MTQYTAAPVGSFHRAMTAMLEIVSRLYLCRTRSFSRYIHVRSLTLARLFLTAVSCQCVYDGRVHCHVARHGNHIYCRIHPQCLHGCYMVVHRLSISMITMVRVTRVCASPFLQGCCRSKALQRDPVSNSEHGVSRHFVRPDRHAAHGASFSMFFFHPKECLLPRIF